MAVASANTSFQRFDGKLDSILRKNLPLELYERLSVIESCIVVTHGGKKSQRLVILGHTALYFAEVPPKTVKRAIELAQIVSSKIINDVPNFLSDTEKENVLHIQIFYTVACSAGTDRSQSASPRVIPHTTKPPSTKSATPTPPRDKRIKLIQSEAGHLATGSLDSLRSSTLSLPPVRSTVDVAIDHEDTIEEGGKHTRVVTLDLYVLQRTRGCSQFNQHLQVLLEDTVMRSMDSGLGRSLKHTARGSYEDQQGSLLANFQSLKSELLLTTNYEESASLLLELKHGADKYYVLKKLYWQDLDIMKYCISQIAQTTVITNQFDQIEYCVIVSDLLATVLTETHVVIDRANFLFHESGSIAIGLVQKMINLFEIFKQHHHEANQLLKELAGNVAGVFYEIIRLSQQVTWLQPSVASAVTATSLSDLISTHTSAVEFLSQVVELVCEVVRDEYSKPFLVQYRAVSFIDKVILYSDKCLKLFQTHFSEEFRYIIHATHSKEAMNDKLNQVRAKILTNNT